MTMTSVAVGPASLSVPHNIMLGPNRSYHLLPQQNSSTSSNQNNAPSPASNKGYETLSKGKKSWSVRLGLSRASSSQQQRSNVQESSQHHHHHYPGVAGGGWGTVSGGSVLAQQMIYAEPWLYGTVRGAPSHHHGYQAGVAPVILVCSCPEFLHGTARDLGSNCRKCGGHRLAGLAAIGGTCRVPTSNVRSRPSLAGMLKPDDPYDLMRRSRLLEPRSSRARSTSPLRLQKEQARGGGGGAGKTASPKVATVEPMSRTEWFDCTSDAAALIDDNCAKHTSEPKDNDWTSKKSASSQDISSIRSQPGRLVRPTKSRSWQSEEDATRSSTAATTTTATTTVGTDSRKSILECDVNPYLLLKNRDEDDLSDNALEHEPNLFDPSKVKSIERIPNRSSVAAIGGQRIRVFNESLQREPSDEEEAESPPPQLTRIPIPKISPKRPPRRLKEAKNCVKSILKKTSLGDKTKRKSVLFNVDNVIVAPDKPPASVVADICISNPPQPQRKTSKSSPQPPPPPPPPAAPTIETAEAPPSEEAVQQRFVTIPNIKQAPARSPPEAKVVPRVVKDTEKIEVASKTEIAKSEETCTQHKSPSLTRSQSDRSNSRPVVSDVGFVDTMRLSYCRAAQESAKKISEPRKRLVKRESKRRPSSVMSPPARIEEEDEPVAVPAVQVRLSGEEHFVKMRPTSWSPPPPKTTSNVCKITVSPPREPPPPPPPANLVHRLQIGTPVATRGTSILINGCDQQEKNKVTISVNSQDTSSKSVCNPTVISINGPPATDQKRTLVIFDSYKSNILIGGEPPPEIQEPQVQQERTTSKPIEIKPKFKVEESSPDSSPRWSQILDAPKSSGSSKEELISKLLEESLRKARENGEILDEGSGEAILKILKQSLLKSSEPSTEYPEVEENAYEVIKEPIYEEIPDEPPPLPLSPPPTEDFLKNRIFFGDEYKVVDEAGTYFKPATSNNQYLDHHFLSKSPETASVVAGKDDLLSSKFELLNFIMDSKERTRNGHVDQDEEEEDEEEEEEEEEEEDPERDLEALYEQKETSLGDLSSKSSQISNVSDSSEECNIILANSPEALKTRTVDIERQDSGVGSESSQASSGRGGVARRWRGSPAPHQPQQQQQLEKVQKVDAKNCEDCEQRLEPLVIDSVYSPSVCRKCSKKRAERKEIITEIVETEVKYGRDLQIILEEFHRPMLRAGLLTQEQLSAIFLNVEELLEHNQILAEKLKDAVEFAQETNDEDLVRVDLGKIFLESERMLHAFESYCTRQGSASLLLQNLEKEKELLRIFLKVSQMENTVLRRMNLNSFLMVPVQRVTKYPLLLSRLLKATPSGRPEVQELKKRLKQAQTNIELHLEHMNAEAKDITSTRLWRRISIIQNGRRSTGEQDMVNIKLRKMAVEVLEWAHEDSRFVLEGRMLVAQPTDNNWRRGRTVKLAPITAMLVTNGKPNNEFVDLDDDSLFPKQIGVKEATLLLVKEKLGRYSLLREPLYLDKCIVCCETDLEDYFEIQELSSKETFIFKAEDGARTKRWCRTLQAHAQSLGAWRRRRGALPNIMICGVARN